MAVGDRTGYARIANIATGTTDVLDDELLPQILAQKLADQSRSDVGRPSGGSRYDDCYVP